jgi:subtilisin family serine protease
MPVAEAEDLQVTENGAARILRAPARDILTLVPDGHYDFASGNSMATAQISGVAALLLARNPKLGVDRVRELLVQSTEKHFTTRGPFYSVNACSALAQVVRSVSCAN